MKYSVNVKYIEFGGRVAEKSLPVNNTRSGNALFESHKMWGDTVSVKLVEKSTGEIIRHWERV